MEIQVEDLARQQLINIYYYHFRYSLENAIETTQSIMKYIDYLKIFPYIGRTIPELNNEYFREIIYRKTRHSAYRIMYYISQKSNIIYVINIINCKQNFKSILKLHNYFSNYFNF